MEPGKKNVPKHSQVASKLRRMIRTGRLAVGEALPTEHALCKQFGCSRGTVRKALDALVNEGLVRRRQGAGHFVARPNPGEREALIGLIVPNVLNAEVVRLTQLFTLEAGSRGYRLLLCVTLDETETEREFLHDVCRLKVAGVIKFPTMMLDVAEFERELERVPNSAHLRYVVVNDFWSESRQFNHVSFDEDRAIEMAVSHLVKLGHTQFGWLDGSGTPRTRALASVRRTLAKHKLELPDKHILLSIPYHVPPVDRLWPERGKGPTAIITPYEGMAVRLIEALSNRGLQVPGDVSVANLNGPPLYTTSYYDLTTAIPPHQDIVTKALDVLLADPADQVICQYLFRPDFHVGETTGTPRVKAALARPADAPDAPETSGAELTPNGGSTRRTR